MRKCKSCGKITKLYQQDKCKICLGDSLKISAEKINYYRSSINRELWNFIPLQHRDAVRKIMEA